MKRTDGLKRFGALSAILIFAFLSLAARPAADAQDAVLAKRLKGLDAYMTKVVKDWNVPGIGVAILSGDKLVLVKGYGYRDYGKKLPFTESTLFQIASNTKLFTAVAAGMLVDEGKLTWDKPVRESVPAIRFYNDELNNTVTLRDMLAHRTGITRHDSIWYKSDFTRKELFEKTKYLEPTAPIRQTFLYNNLMYAAAGYIIELQSGKTWENFVRERIFAPLDMTSTVFTVEDMEKAADHAVPFTEKRDSFELYQIPIYAESGGVAPCGAIVSNIRDISHWLTALMNEGKYQGKQVLPADVLKATLEPAIALPNVMAETWGYWELLNSAYGMARETASYRGHLLTSHGGDLPGLHSQISFLPKEKLGVIVFVIGNHCSQLYDLVSWNLYERLLGLDETPWSARMLEMRLKGKKAGTEARAKAGADRVPNTMPSHKLSDYAAEYENPAYGVLKVTFEGAGLQSDFHKIKLPLSHVHYDRFDTPDDEQYGKFSINFRTSPQGDVDKAVISLDEAEAVFTRKADKLAPEMLAKLAGTYETPTGIKFQAVLKEDGSLNLVFPGQGDEPLIPYKGLKFRIKAFSDVIWEFVLENGEVKGLKQTDPSGEVVFKRI
jgi:CubicO group peptidase (beta-lactamase class C family)